MTGPSSFLNRRRVYSSILVGTACACFLYSITLWNRFMQTQPRTAEPAKGAIYPMNNHGWYYYLSATQADQMMILRYSAFGFGLFAFVTKAPEKPWELYQSVSDISWTHFWRSVILSAAAAWLLSPYLASFLASKGVVFDPW